MIPNRRDVMQVMTQDRFGGAEVLRMETRADPVPGPGEVRVRMAAAGVNPADVAVRTGALKLFGEPPFVLGWDVAGVVDALGPGVTGFAIGDRVFGMLRLPAEAGAYATHVIAPASELVQIPAGLGDIEAGALPLAGLTALQALVRHGQLRAGQRVLIHGGAGGVGHLAVQIAVALGAEVTATASVGKLDVVRRLGPARVLNYATDPIGSGYDLVIDPQANVQAMASVAATRDGGRVVCLLTPPETAVAAAKARGIDCSFFMVAPDAAGLAELLRLFSDGALKVLVARQFPLAEAGLAHDFLATRPVGKIVLQP
jgi:NADPH:quinone reductase-like Zn-dependent oxidoreductase